MPEVFMPRLSDTMTEGTVSVWSKAVGDHVDKGDILAEIETDKATMELEAYDAGVLEQILVQPGSTVPIGEVIAIIGDGSGTSKPAPAATPAATPAVTPATEPAASNGAASPAAPADTAAPAPTPAPTAPTAPAATSAPATVSAPVSAGPVKASPLARAIARDAGLDLATVKGSGPGGRIVRADVNDAVAAMGNATTSAAPTAAATLAPAAAPISAGADDVEVKLSNIRKVTARRLVESKQQVPHFYLTRVIDAQELVEARARINTGLSAIAASTDQTPVKVSVNDLVVKAVAVALRAHPEMNVSFAGDKLIRHGRVHVGVAVSLDDGLIVPVLRDTDTLTVTQISTQTKELAGRARAGKLTPAEFTGGTFSISNLGMFGVDEFAAVINPPEAAILAVGAAKEEAVARNGQVVVRNTMRVTLSIDHRAVDGATGARFLATLAGLLENPLATLA
jgi:pyruvate dehydrogenase E2 component (dihydrolipoamide acetyltransferase)